MNEQNPNCCRHGVEYWRRCVDCEPKQKEEHVTSNQNLDSLLRELIHCAYRDGYGERPATDDEFTSDTTNALVRIRRLVAELEQDVARYENGRVVLTQMNERLQFDLSEAKREHAEELTAAENNSYLAGRDDARRADEPRAVACSECDAIHENGRDWHRAWCSKSVAQPPVAAMPKPINHDLWRHLHDEHGLTLLQSELDEILRHAEPPGARHTLDCDMVRHPNCTRCSCGSAEPPPATPTAISPDDLDQLITYYEHGADVDTEVSGELAKRDAHLIAEALRALKRERAGEEKQTTLMPDLAEAIRNGRVLVDVLRTAETKSARACTHRFTIGGLRNPQADDTCDGCGKTWKDVQDALSAELDERAKKRMGQAASPLCDCPEVCKVCGGRAKACAIVGHRSESDRSTRWHTCKAVEKETPRCESVDGVVTHDFIGGRCIKCKQTPDETSNAREMLDIPQFLRKGND